MQIFKVDTLDIMEAAVNPAVFVTFNGKEIPIIARTLSNIEIQSCGEFSLINLNSDKGKQGENKDPFVIMAEYAEIQHNVLKLAMVNPTYEQVEEMLLKSAGVEGFHQRMEEVKAKFIFEKNPQAKEIMEKEYAMLEMRSKFFFPADFLIEMFEFATEQDKSDIKKLVSEEILLNAAILAENKCLTSDILCKDGYFSEFNRFDINKRAAIILHEHRNKEK